MSSRRGPDRKRAGDSDAGLGSHQTQRGGSAVEQTTKAEQFQHLIVVPRRVSRSPRTICRNRVLGDIHIADSVVLNT